MVDPSNHFGEWEPLVTDAQGHSILSTIPIRKDRRTARWFANNNGERYYAVLRNIGLADILQQVELKPGPTKTLSRELIDLLKQN